MAKIKTLKDNNNETVYPQTVGNAIVDGSIPGGKIVDGTITASKLSQEVLDSTPKQWKIDRISIDLDGSLLLHCTVDEAPKVGNMYVISGDFQLPSGVAETAAVTIDLTDTSGKFAPGGLSVCRKTGIGTPNTIIGRELTVENSNLLNAKYVAMTVIYNGSSYIVLDTEKLANNSVGTANLGAKVVTGAKIADNTIASSNIDWTTISRTLGFRYIGQFATGSTKVVSFTDSKSIDSTQYIVTLSKGAGDGTSCGVWFLRERAADYGNRALLIAQKTSGATLTLTTTESGDTLTLTFGGDSSYSNAHIFAISSF